MTQNVGRSTRHLLPHGAILPLILCVISFSASSAPRSEFIEVAPHVKLHILDSGGASARPTLVLIPGWRLTASIWAHQIDAFYLGWTGDGHIGWVNLTHAFYWVLGHDQLNNLAGRPVDINAQMFALELSYDRDFIRPKLTFLYASGDRLLQRLY